MINALSTSRCGVAIKASMPALQRVPSDIQTLGTAAKWPLASGFFPGTAQAIRVDSAQEFTIDASGNGKSFHGAEEKLHSITFGNRFQPFHLLLPVLPVLGDQGPASPG
jgi:hypothetical protein